MQNNSDIRNVWFKEQIDMLLKQGMKKNQIASRMSIVAQQLTNILNGNRNVSEKFARAFCDEFNINHNDLISRMKVYQNDLHIVSDVVKDVRPHDVSESTVPLIPIDAVAGYGKG